MRKAMRKAMLLRLRKNTLSLFKTKRNPKWFIKRSRLHKKCRVLDGDCARNTNFLTEICEFTSGSNQQITGDTLCNWPYVPGEPCPDFIYRHSLTCSDRCAQAYNSILHWSEDRVSHAENTNLHRFCDNVVKNWQLRCIQPNFGLTMG